MCYLECVATSPLLVHWRHLCPTSTPVCLLVTMPYGSFFEQSSTAFLWISSPCQPRSRFLPREDYSVAQKGRSQRFLEWEGSRKILRGFDQDDQFPREDYTQNAKVSWAYKLIYQPILSSPFLFFIWPDNKYIMRILLCSNKTKERY